MACTVAGGINRLQIEMKTALVEKYFRAAPR